MSPIVAVVIALVVGWVVGVMMAAERLTNARPDSGLRVEVGPSHDPSGTVQHMMSARIVDRKGKALHFERVDMRNDGWEEEMAVAVVEMKHKLRALEAARRIARESIP